MVTFENIKEAYYSIRSNFLRSLLTLLIIAIGITCLVGILTAIDTILFSMSDNFNRLGANSYSIRPGSENISSVSSGKKKKKNEEIIYSEAAAFKDRFQKSGAVVSIDMFCSGSATLKYKDIKSNPTFQVRGADNNFFQTSAFEMEKGRVYTSSESNKVVIGSEVVKVLFNGIADKAVGQTIIVDGNRFSVVGTLKEKGSGQGNSTDKRVYLPLDNARSLYSYPNMNYNITVSVQNPTMMDQYIEETIGVLRSIRGLRPIDPIDFEIRKSDAVLNKLKDITSQLRLATVVIAMLTLLGASIGLMNIMLVSVTERTREIGVRKSLGATSQNILIQFLVEAVLICILGGIVGVLMGIGMGFLVTVLIKGKFLIPWAWMLLGMVVCVFVGIVSGLYPAMKAARLDPIESLRYE